MVLAARARRPVEGAALTADEQAALDAILKRD